MNARDSKISLRALIVEDNPFDAELIVRQFEEAGYDLQWTRVTSEAEFLDALDTAPDVILSDYNLPRFSGLRALALFRERGIDIPFILVSGTVGEDIAVAAMVAGARDYVLKDTLARLVPAVQRELQECALRRDRSETRARLAQQTRNLGERVKELTCLYKVSGLTQQSGLQIEELLEKTVEFLVKAYQWPDIACARIVHGKTARQTAGFRLTEWRQEAHLTIDGASAGTVTVCYVQEPPAAGKQPFLVEEQLMLDAIAQRISDSISDRRLRAALAEKDRSFRTTFNQAAVGIVHTSIDSRYLEVNQKFCDMTGYARDELLGMNTALITHPDDRLDDLAQRKLLLGNQIETYTGEKRYVRKDGSIFWAQRTVSLARDEAGQPMHFIRVVEDITERKQLTARTEQTFGQAAVGIVRADLDRNIIDVNQKFCELTGYERDELLRMTVIQISHPDDRGQDTALRTQLLAGEFNHFRSEKRYLRKDGGIIWVRRTTSLVRDALSHEPHYIIVVEDITDRKATEESYRATFDRAPVGIMHSSLDSRILHVNPKLCEILGYTGGELLTMTLADIIEPDYRGVEIAKFLEPLMTGKIESYSSERRFTHKNGSKVWVNRHISLVRDAAGQPLYFLRIIEDITDRKNAETALLESERFAKSTIDALSEHLCVLDETGTIVAVNKAWLDFSAANGSAAHQSLEKGANYLTVCDAVTDANAAQGPEFAAGIRAVLNGDREEFALEYSCHSANEQRWFCGKVTPFQGVGPRRVVVTHENITRRKEAQAALLESDEKFRELTRNIPQVFWMTDAAQESTIYVSPSYENITGRRITELESEPQAWLKAIHGEDRERVKSARRERALLGTYDIEYRLLHADSSLRWIHDRAFPVRNTEGEVYRIAGIAEDITERKLAQEQLANLAHYDSLTGLPNRVLFKDRLRQAAAQARRNQWIVGVLFLDLDRFKLVNDTLGHASGDLLLKEVAVRLIQCLRPTDTVGRLSGDEFAVILPELSAPQNAGYVAQKILDALTAPFNLEGSEVFVTTSIGITLYPSDSESIDTLIRDADAAMYSAKGAGRNNYQYYTTAMNARATEKLQMETGIRRALERGELLLHYQPKIDVASGNICGLEALLRWKSPEHGLVSPAQFIPLLEETGLIVPVGEWVTRATCAQLQAWRMAGVKTVPVAINLSARQLRQQGYARVLEQAMKDFDVNPELIRVEITESSLMENPEEAIIVLQSLKALGIRLDADDFGTGYSSLSYLKRFPLDALKIDRSFVRDITTDEDDAVIAKTVITLAHSLGLKVVAEGVETEAQLAFLGANRCDEAQGYLFSKPLCAETCTTLLANGLPLHHKQATEPAEQMPAILLVDDNARDLELTRMSLQKDGHNIIAAAGAHDAFKLLASNRVGIVISDANMPEMSGVAFLRQVKLMYPDIVRIMLSGGGDFGTAASAINEGEVHKLFIKGQDAELLRREIKRKIWHAPGHDIPAINTLPRHPGRPQRRLTTD